VKTFKEFLAESELTLLAGLITNLMKKGEAVQVRVKQYPPPEKKRIDVMMPIVKMIGNRVELSDTGFTLGEWDDDHDITLAKEDGIWTVRENGEGLSI
jgi:hypothetical protein